jgi:3-dehydrosphinganine reductase
MKTFDGKNALITGGSSGIGLALAKLLAQEGANIWLLGRDPQKLDQACKEVNHACRDNKQQVHVIQADVSDKEEIDHALSGLTGQIGAPDLLINSAGITHPGLFEQMDLSHHRDNMEINYFGTLYTTMAVVPGMIQRKTGHIVNISSLVGIHGLYGYSAYAPSKFALRGLSDVLRYELMPYGIHVSVVFPSDTETPQLDYENKHKPAILKALSESNTKPVSAESVAVKTLRAVKKGRYMILPTSDGVMWFIAYCLLPGDIMYRMVDFLMVQARRKAGKDIAGK